ncbi:hypothetical protein CkaCkLH20_13122 [Colletotrichum karsti]|uniref:Methyltransferase domain-containing protein n=1 Tax=Colletotrichum karsti TaxID=1095194 RepID=A0A9P6HT49_9PEZI|nr:uncharacterized protein CkaCkLH20_13122 [Colletotrichum karsti]KAF9869405.1 hypothetical protein CkaCkLH20_13122 [Colletotrichum karsti]
MPAELSEAEALATPEFWNERYTQSDGSNPTHEWFRTFAALEPYFKKHLFSQYPPETVPRIMHLGSGDSTIPADLAERGYKNQLCLDFSTVVVDLMKSRHQPLGGIEWRWADVRDMPDAAPTKSIDVAFDKGTMDAMIHGSPWSPPDDVKDNTSRYLREVHRALKDEGVFLYITYRQPHFMKPLLNSEGLWELEMDVLSGGESSFDYYGFILRKKAEP